MSDKKDEAEEVVDKATDKKPKAKAAKKATATKKAAKKTTKKAEKKPVKRRAQRHNYLPFAEARAFVRSQMIHSVRAYEVWWQQDKPADIPRFPYRAYAVDWVSWNDYLGNDNDFEPGNRRGTGWRDFDEARAFVHQLGLKSSYEWMSYARNAVRDDDEPSEQDLMNELIEGDEEGEKHEANADLPMLPRDIPKRPDIAYKDSWIGWNHWLGNNVYDRMNLVAEQIKSSIFYIIQDPANPSNVFNFGVEIGGLRAMKEMYERKPYHLVRFFWHDPDKHEVIDNIIKHYSYPYLGDEGNRVSHNIWYVVEEIQEVIDVVSKEDMVGTR